MSVRYLETVFNGIPFRIEKISASGGVRTGTARSVGQRLTELPDSSIILSQSEKENSQELTQFNPLPVIHGLDETLIYTVELQWLEHLWDHEN